MEILIAVAVLAIGVVAVVNLFPVGLQAAKRTAGFTKVGLLVQEATEFYRSEGYGYIHERYEYAGSYGGVKIDFDGVDVAFIPAPFETDPDEIERGGGMEGAIPFSGDEDYFWRLVISPDVEPGGIEDVDGFIYKITLHIYWLDSGQEQWDFFETHIANYD